LQCRLSNLHTFTDSIRGQLQLIGKDPLHIGADWKALLKLLQEHFIFCPTDKSPKSIAVTCIRCYKEQVSRAVQDAAIRVQQSQVESALKKAQEYLTKLETSLKINLPKDEAIANYVYVTPKLHKPTKFKVRDIMGRPYRCTDAISQVAKVEVVCFPACSTF
jgi:hypothetical protein